MHRATITNVPMLAMRKAPRAAAPAARPAAPAARGGNSRARTPSCPERPGPRSRRSGAEWSRFHASRAGGAECPQPPDPANAMRGPDNRGPAPNTAMRGPAQNNNTAMRGAPQQRNFVLCNEISTPRAAFHAAVYNRPRGWYSHRWTMERSCRPCSGRRITGSMIIWIMALNRRRPALSGFATAATRC